MRSFVRYLRNRICGRRAAGVGRPAIVPTPHRPTRNFDEFFLHVKGLGFVPRTVVDVGAGRGTHSMHGAFPDAYFILFEPLPEFAPELETLMADYRGEIHHHALMAEEGEASILRIDDPVASSLMHSFAPDEDPRLIPLRVKTLDGVLGERTLDPPILLKTDCQGGDLEAVRGGEAFLERCDMVIMELSMFKFWGPRDHEAFEVLAYMDRQGFAIYDFLDGMFRPLDGALAQIDVVFVKKSHPLRSNRLWA